MSIARRHKQRVRAEKQSVNLEVGNISHTSQGALMQAQLATHLRQLSQIQSIERKIALKNELLPEYAAYVEGILAGQSGHQDDVIMTVLVWRIDVGDFTGALAIASYAIKHDLTMPQRFSRDLATLLVEEIASQAINDPESEGTRDHLQDILELTQNKDMPDEVRAKLHKALGLSLQQPDPKQAMAHFERALALNPRAGVKKQLDKLKKQHELTS
jgi:tetratricopeptide (TPR) repeat protein